MTDPQVVPDAAQGVPTAPAPRKARARKAAKPKPALTDLGPIQVLTYTCLGAWQWQEAVDAGLIPAADVDGHRWSVAVADQVIARHAEIIAAVGTERPIGGHKAADRLAERTGLAVEKWDVEALADAGLLRITDYYKEWPLYSVRDLDALDAAALAPVVAERQAWMAASVSKWDAPARLGWERRDFEKVAKDRGLRLGRFERYAIADLDALAGDEDLAEQIRRDKLLMTHQAAVFLEIREADFKWLVAADLAVPAKYTLVEITRYRDVSVPLYRVGDLEDLRDHPLIDWEEVRGIKPGKPSPLRHLARRPVDRAAVIRRGVAELGDRFGVEVWAWFNNGSGGWEVDFDRHEDAPTVREFRAAIAAHPYLREHIDDISVATEAGAAVRWARAMREPGKAVILDTETTDLVGYVVEVAVLDAATGETLLDTLVNPGCPVEPGARWVHGISDEELAGAPRLAEVWPQLLQATAGKTVLAYNSDFDYSTVVRHARRDGLDPCHLADSGNWLCLMGRRSDWLMRYRWLPLGGGHRARGDCEVAFDLLAAMTAPARMPKAARR